MNIQLLSHSRTEASRSWTRTLSRLLVLTIALSLLTAVGAAATFTVDDDSTSNPDQISSALLPVTHSFGGNSVTRSYDGGNVVLDADTSDPGDYAAFYVDNDTDGTVEFQIEMNGYNNSATPEGFPSELNLWKYDGSEWTNVEEMESDSEVSSFEDNYGILIDYSNKKVEIPVDNSNSGYQTTSEFKYSVDTASDSYASGDAGWAKEDTSGFSTVYSDSGNSEDTVEVAEGTYNEAVEISTSDLTLASTGSRNNTVVAASSGTTNVVKIQPSATGVTIKGFTLKGADRRGIFVGDFGNAPANTRIENNYITNLGRHTKFSTSGDKEIHGILVEEGADSSVIVDNRIYNLQDGGSGRAVGVSLVSQGSTGLDSVTVENNVIKSIKADSGSGDKAKGIELSGKVTSTVITDNEVKNIGDGAETEKPRGLAMIEQSIDGSTVGPTNFQVTGNTFDNINSNYGGTIVEGPATVFIGGYPTLGSSHKMRNNSFLDGIVRQCCSSSQPTLDAEKNYWDASSGPSNEGPGTGTIVSTAVDYKPWYATSDFSEDVEVVDSSDATRAYSGTVQGGVDATNSGDMVRVGEGTYSLVGSQTVNGESAGTVKVEGSDKDGITITAVGERENTVVSFEHEPTPGSNPGEPVFNILSDNVVVDGFTVERVMSGGNDGSERFSQGIRIEGTNVTISNNDVALVDDSGDSTDSNTNLGVAVLGGNGGAEIVNNTIRNFDYEFDGTIKDSGIFVNTAPNQVEISGNNISANGNGIFVDGDDENVLVTDNSILDNSVGVVNADDTDPVDAEYNYWGAASGPSGDAEGTGDVVTGDVDYRPWLLQPNGDQYDQTLAIRDASGWALASAPQLLVENPTIVDDDGSTDGSILTHQGGSFLSPGDSGFDSNVRTPTGAFFVNTDTTAGIGFTYENPSDPGTTSKQLTEGWNLIGTNNNEEPAVDGLSGIQNVDGNPGLLTFFVPETRNAKTDIGISWADNAERDLNANPISELPSGSLSAVDGYWAYLAGDRTHSKQLQ